MPDPANSASPRLKWAQGQHARGDEEHGLCGQSTDMVACDGTWMLMILVNPAYTAGLADHTGTAPRYVLYLSEVRFLLEQQGSTAKAASPGGTVGR